MKKIYWIIAILFLFFNSANSQITIHSTDLPVTGSIYRVSLAQPFTGMNAALTDTNFTWDYSQLISTSQTLDTFVSVLSTGFIYSAVFIFNSTYAQKSNSAPLAIPVLTIDYEYDFYKKSTTSYVQTGFGARMNSFPVPTPYSPKDTVYRFPLQIGNVGVSQSAFSITVPSLGFYGGNKTRTDTVDGWGTLITPYGSFDALRIKSVITERDSIHIDTILHYGFSVPRNPVTEYKWLGIGQGIPLLQINTSGAIVTQIIYRDSLRTAPLSVNNDLTDEYELTVFPNPASGKVLLLFNLQKTEKVNVIVTDISGNKIFSEDFGIKSGGRNFALINLEEKKFSSGMYILNLETGNKVITRKIQLVK